MCIIPVFQIQINYYYTILHKFRYESSSSRPIFIRDKCAMKIIEPKNRNRIFAVLLNMDN